MTDSISFQVRGLPVPQGSMRTYVIRGRPVTTSAARGLKDWRRLVADVAQGYAQEAPWEGPVSVELCFTLPRPKSEPKRRRTWPDRRPDLDKCVRAVLDALTGVLIADDSQVVGLHACKDWGAPGVRVDIRRVTFEASS